MDEDARRKLRLALNIVVGVFDIKQLAFDDYVLLGYDNFIPENDEIRRAVVDILYRALITKEAG